MHVPRIDGPLEVLVERKAQILCSEICTIRSSHVLYEIRNQTGSWFVTTVCVWGDASGCGSGLAFLFVSDNRSNVIRILVS